MQLTRDAAGNRIGMVDAVGMTTYAYDRLRRLTATSDPFGKTVGYGYDQNGNRASLRYPDGTTATYSYDALDRLTAVGDGIGGTNRYRYDPVGNQTAADFANGSAARATYDPLDRITAIANLDGRGKTASRFGYAYDQVGNLTSERAGRGEDADERGTTYRYDPLSRLVGVAGGEHDRITYRYDPVGNRIATLSGDDDNDEGALGATFDAADQLTALVRTNGRPVVQFSYDANGNLLTRTGGDDHSASFTYDAADRLTTVADPEQGTTTYRYDGDGTLVSETATRAGERDEDHRPAGPTTLQYTIDHAAPLSQILSATDGQAVARYLYGTGRIASQGTTTRYYGSDVRGSVRSLTDGSGTRVATRGYDAWGSPTEADAGDHDRDGRTDLSALFGYTGERQDPSTGLVYLRARWYNPALGTLLQVDPFPGLKFDPQSLQTYAYGRDDPVGRIDPSGLSTQSIFSSGALALSTADRIVAGRSTSLVRQNALRGAEFQAEVRSYLETIYDPQLYEIVENRALVNSEGRTVAVQVAGKLRTIRPDFQIINRASQRVVAVYEAKIGQLTYLKTRGAQALFRIQDAASRLGYEAPRVEAVYQVRETIKARGLRVSGGRLAKGANIIGAILMILGLAAEQREMENIQRQLDWLKQNDPAYYNELYCEFGGCA